MNKQLTILDPKPLTREEILASALHWRNLAEQLLATGRWEVAQGIAPDLLYHQKQAALYIETAERIEAKVKRSQP